MRSHASNAAWVATHWSHGTRPRRHQGTPYSASRYNTIPIGFFPDWFLLIFLISGLAGAAGSYIGPWFNLRTVVRPLPLNNSLTVRFSLKRACSDGSYENQAKLFEF